MSAAQQTTADTRPQPRNFRVIASIVAVALFMEQLDGTVVSTALPSMARSFDVHVLHMSLALTSYLVSLAVFIPASGVLADRFGTKRVFNAAIILFTLGSILCAQATSLDFFVIARIVQGIGGAMMVPVGRLILLRSVQKSDMVSAMAWFLVPALIGPVIGPPVGGLITTYLSWHWIFYINIPVGILGGALATLLIPDIRENRAPHFDLPGFGIAAITLASLTFGFTLAARGADAAVGLALIAIGLVGLAGYVAYAWNRKDAILDLRLLRVQTFRVSTVGGSFSRITWGAIPFLLPTMMQVGFGKTAAESGAITFVAAAGAMLMKVTAGPILRRFGFRRVLIWNQLLATGSILCCAGFTPATPMPLIYAILLAGGFFASLQFTAYNTIAYADLRPERMSAATSFYTVIQQIMLSMGICLSAAVLSFSSSLAGHHLPELGDFHLAFLVVGVVSLVASPICAGLPGSAGAEMVGRKQAA